MSIDWRTENFTLPLEASHRTTNDLGLELLFEPPKLVHTETLQEFLLNFNDLSDLAELGVGVRPRVRMGWENDAFLTTDFVGGRWSRGNDVAVAIAVEVCSSKNGPLHLAMEWIEDLGFWVRGNRDKMKELRGKSKKGRYGFNEEIAYVHVCLCVCSRGF